MRAHFAILAILFAACFFVGCASTQSSRLRAYSPDVVEQVRSRVLDQLPTLDAASREMIQTNTPRILFVSLPFGGDYTFRWMITSDRIVELYAGSTLAQLSERPVSVRELSPASRY